MWMFFQPVLYSRFEICRMREVSASALAWIPPRDDG